MIEIGSKINDKYRLVSRIAEGGMAEIYEAISLDKKDKKRYAIKFLLESLIDNEDNIKRFEHERDIISNLSHPNIVSVIDYGIYNNRPYMVLEYIKFQTLGSKLSLGYKFSTIEVIDIALKLCDALKYLHNHGILHRDIKPENIYYGSEGEVKLSDFGIATDLANISSNDRKMMGTVQYLDPEIVQGKNPNKLGDIYSFGITLYELACGTLPFNGDDAIDVAISQIKNDLPLPSSINKEIPKELEDIIVKATMKDSKNRYQSIGEMKDDLLLINEHRQDYVKKKSFFEKLFGFRRKQ